MVITIAVCLAMGLATVLARAFGLPKLNATSVFTMTWVPVLLLAGLFGGVSDPLLELTWSMIILGWLSLVVGTLTGWSKYGKAQLPKPARPVVIDISRTRKMHLLLTCAFVLYVAIQLRNALPLISQSGGWSVIFSSSGNAYRNASLQQALEQSQSELASDSVILSLFTYCTFIAGTVATYTGAVLWLGGYRIIGILPVVVAASLSLITLQRTSVVLVALLFIFGVATIRLSKIDVPQRYATQQLDKIRGETAAPRRPQRFRALVAAVCVTTALTAFLYSTTNIRDGAKDVSIGRQVGEYLVGGVAGLNSHNADGADWIALPGLYPGTSDPSPGLGGYTFSGLWAVLYRLGTPVQLTRVNLNFTPVTLYDQPTLTNVTTAFGEYYLDFRWIGLVAIPFLVGWTTSRLQRKIAGSRTIVAVPAVALLLTISFWSFFVAWFSDFRQLLIAALGGVVLTWAVRRRLGASPSRSAKEGAAQASETRPVKRTA